MTFKRPFVALAAVAAIASLCLAGCTSVGYYWQSVSGHMRLINAARPVDEWLADAQTPEPLKARLAMTQRIRSFAVSDLKLPDNASYHRYADLRRSAVVWNVVAAPELSLTLITWCFPVVGCVGYRGYFNELEARAEAAQLKAQGLEVSVYGVPAYSTLGWFNDPLLSTFIDYPDAELARLMFHELAHQLLYVAGDAPFNEAFATAVEEAGMQRWVALHDDAVSGAIYVRNAARRQDFVALLDQHRKALAIIYAHDMPDQRKREQKTRIFGVLRDDYRVLKHDWGGYAGYDRWFAAPLSNAHLASIATYHELLPAFRALLAQHKNLPDFYAAVRVLARRSQPERDLFFSNSPGRGRAVPGDS